MKEEKYSNKSLSSDIEVVTCDAPLMDHKKSRYPFCIVWTPLPMITWVCPLIGHMGIAMSSGVIRDFAGPYYVSEDDMAFGKPTKYWQLSPDKARGGRSGWDAGVTEASEIYKERMHNICCDNCHSHVACALNIMQYDGSTSWNMVKLWFYMLVYGKYVSFYGLLKTWLPFLIFAGSLLTIIMLLHYL
ncbi:transmembrane protein 222-like [Argiope bruennichi]|uniref:Transmembrane protein 222 like protein n=1 Tax=Argiope bruennichi TaxID=94029 RepID=A0A8T0EVN9_ARGBR|nr:transmembrane protein 222-like [Argiope bruennichi]KAF8778099.1 Transmembrane protein 222 like protein [Argiope bruennichi]